MFPQQNTVTDYHPFDWAATGKQQYSDYPSWPNPDQPVSGAGDAVASTMNTVYAAASLIGATSGAYHGYKRNQSVGWAIGWFVFGGLLPFLSVPIMFAEGFAERKH